MRSLLRSARVALLVLAASCAAVTPALAQTIRAGNGTAATPSITFNSQLGIGIFRAGTNDIRVSAGGSDATSFRFFSNGNTNNTQFLVQNGAAASPAITFWNSVSTGLYRFGTDTLAVSTGGTARWRTQATGFSLLTGQLFVPDGSAGAPTLTFSTGGGTEGWYRSAASTLAAAAGGAHALTITAAPTTIIGGANNFTLQCGTGNSRTCTFQTTTSAGTAKNTLVLGADSSATFLGQARAMVGSLAIPSLSFAGDVDKGWYSEADNVMTAVAGGIRLGTFINSGGSAQFAAEIGTLAVPSIAFNGATTTGLKASNNGSSDTLVLVSNALAFAKGLHDTLIVNSKAKAPALTTASGTPNAWCIDATTKEALENAAADCTVSAARFKFGITQLDPMFATRSVMAMRPSAWTYIDGGREALGLVADNVDSIDARLGFRTADGQINSYDQAGVLGLLVATVQQQQRALDSLRVAFPLDTNTGCYQRRAGEWRWSARGVDRGPITYQACQDSLSRR